jgi:cellulose synthase (UDP-forming)
MGTFSSTQTLTKRTFRLLAISCSLFLLFQFISLYLSWPKQAALGGIIVVMALVLNRKKQSQVVTIGLMLISLAATLRYAWWRIRLILQFFGDESNNRLSVSAVLMLILISAEAYTVLVMVLGYMQTSAPLRRKPIPLPSDESFWPHVDVLIPTYNEPLSLVRYTALAAINVDYPPDKLHVYILDDGTREDFKIFAEESGVGYVTRKEHNHAKAGNINHALKQMKSPLVTIFDCDHVPTRSFLQITVGWFLADNKLAMLQTPHFFYSPDPFERNLLQYKSIPNEGELFYGVIQDGNDLWNATFFCGSCAVLRRSALNEVGGIATETVTEDAHTSLRMQKHGWNTAYINLPQAAGLATETLSAHVGQRIRWARGMIQILRTDNPLLASGMKFTQRLCYFNAMLHFMYAVPRLIFLCAPLAYMIFGLTIIPGYWVAILAYALPHLVISGITNSRVQGKHRHSFWNEIYETILAPYILAPTLLALINPKLGKFNVTDKGSTLSETRFDRHIAAPTTWLLALNLLGVCLTPYRLAVTDPHHPGTVISNLIWILFNMVILGVAAAVANEQKQRRTSVRIPAKLAVRLHLPDGGLLSGITKDMSVGGSSLTCADSAEIENGAVLQISFPHQTGDAQVGANIVGRNGDELRIRFDAATIAEQETLTRALYSRADSWIGSRDGIEEDRPLLSLVRVIKLSLTGFDQVIRGLLPEKRVTAIGRFAEEKVRAGGLLLLCLLVHTICATSQVPIVENALPARSQIARQVPSYAVVTGGPTSNSMDVGPSGFTPSPRPESSYAISNQKISLKDMGVQSSIDMHGPHSLYSVGFVLGHDLIPQHATLELVYHFSPSIRPDSGSIKVLLNKTVVGEIKAPEQVQQNDDHAVVSFPLPAELLVRDNDLSFEFTGGTTLQLRSQATSMVLASVGSSSKIRISGDRIPFRNDLGMLPLPFFDADLQTTTTIPFVFLSPPTPATLQAAGIVASWLGILASSKPVRFSVSIGHIPPGNVVVFANNNVIPSALQIPVGGSSLSVKRNPSDSVGSALVLAGDNDVQLLMVARSLALTHSEHLQAGEAAPRLGESIRGLDFALPPPRKPDDAPRWLTTEKLNSLWSLSSELAMQSDGSKPIPIYFRVPPDLYYGENQNLNLNLTYRYNAQPLAVDSALRIFINGLLINEAPLLRGTDFADRQRSVLLPVTNMRPFGNTFLFHFDFVPSNPNQDGQEPTEKLKGAILQNSYLDIRGLDHWASMPNLELFANAGFPFTQRADLAETGIVMPSRPTPKEIELLLYLMSHCGMQTGYPALRVEVFGPEATMRSDHDYMILGGIDDQPAFTSLDSALPVSMDANGIHVKEHSDNLSTVRRVWQKLTGEKGQESQPSNNAGIPDLIIQGIESPSYAGRSIVLVEIRNDGAVDEFANIFLERSQSSDIAHSIALLRNGKFSSYETRSRTYHVGTISPYSRLRIWLAEYFWFLLCIVCIVSLVLAAWISEYLAWLAANRLKVNYHS